MEDNKEEIDNKMNDKKKIEYSKEWKEFEEFYEAHILQLYGLNFPKELAEKLFFKLKYEIFDSGRFFEILEDTEEQEAHVKTKSSLKKNMDVFLIDHFWTFKLRQIDTFFDQTQYPNLISRANNMIKFRSKRIPITKMSVNSIETKKNLIEYLEYLKEKNSFVDLDYEDYELEERLLDDLTIDHTTKLLSLQFNKIHNFKEITDILNKFNGIKAIWLEGNPFEDEIEDYEQILIKDYKNLEIINRKLTPNSTIWAVAYLKSHLKKNENFFKNDEIYIDLSGRFPLNPDNLDIFLEISIKKNYIRYC